MGYQSYHKQNNCVHKAWLMLGGNLGDVDDTFRKALDKLEKAGVRVAAKSALYQSEGWGEGAEGFFYNQAIEVLTHKEPFALLKLLNEIEASLGRKRKPGVMLPRTVDIDILFFDDIVVSLPELLIPHPRLHLRRFVLKPLCEIAPELKHPLLDKTVSSLLQETADPLMVEKFGSL